eukprot:365129-Chlamydomonas_euryale.AAC.18
MHAHILHACRRVGTHLQGPNMRERLRAPHFDGAVAAARDIAVGTLVRRNLHHALDDLPAATSAEVHTLVKQTRTCSATLRLIFGLPAWQPQPLTRDAAPNMPGHTCPTQFSIRECEVTPELCFKPVRAAA